MKPLKVCNHSRRDQCRCLNGKDQGTVMRWKGLPFPTEILNLIWKFSCMVLCRFGSWRCKYHEYAYIERLTGTWIVKIQRMNWYGYIAAAGIVI
jgi:hypothetical protein